MNSYERIKAALSHKEADRVPVYPILCGITRKLVGATYKEWSTNAEICANAFIKSTELFDIDCVVTLIDLSVECDAWGQKLMYFENEAVRPDYSDCVVKSLEDYKKIIKTDYRKSKRMMMHMEVCQRLVKELKGKKPIIAFVFGPLGVLSMLRGQQDLFLDIYDDPDSVKAAVKEINETLKEYVAALCDTGVDAVMLDTLFASGSIMSKKMWIDLESEAVKELSEIISKKGCLTMVHNCGRNIYFDAQIEAMKPAAISFLYPPDDCEDFYECKRKYGDKTTLIGCVTPADATFGTDEEWDRQCIEQIDAMAEGGGFILATGCEYPANASFERAERMIEIAKTYGRYTNLKNKYAVLQA
ncbi:MAG: uroporphyrinogen decarboxylase [Clostridiaceae bacterium]|nr:uroporphyrinogen decarboxylase [Clostridiaceae bacterium]